MSAGLPLEPHPRRRAVRVMVMAVVFVSQHKTLPA